MDRQIGGGAHPPIHLLFRGECREEMCDGPRMYSRQSPIAFFRQHEAADDGGELMKEGGPSANETRWKKLDTVWQVPVRKKQGT